MTENFFTPPGGNSNDGESFKFVFEKLLNGKFFLELAMVTKVSGEAPNLVVDVIPLVTQTDHTGAMIKNSTIYNVPVFRLQRGNSAIIMNPVPGDIGMIAVCDRDNSVVRANRSQSVPGSRRTHSKSDALYLGGFLNEQPSQYIEFADNQINIVSPGDVTVTCQKATVTAPGGVDMTTPLLKVSGGIESGGDISAAGDIIDNSGTQSASIKQLRDAYDDHDHKVNGIQTGSGSVTSEKPGNPV
ncbi:phage baseplate protein [Edwardsiella piscicida]|uniref:Putative baseplate protein n=1 Tax=Edwardsiella phage GF-2 TaxID=1537091 RepID=A0A077KAY0_9CAUD|nr:phage baseplate protein [Edwardsiella piscicida]YP_009126630.1 baseplate spike [Edwardsiella phage GF-2]UCQ36378.1 phage baseplate protein [Edwardsiella piscicida]BAP28898.1 putative baseplate protein [Edwardsiella phage GF-2]